MEDEEMNWIFIIIIVFLFYFVVYFFLKGNLAIFEKFMH